MHDVVLALALAEVHPGHLLIPGERRIAAANASVIFPIGAVEAIGRPSWRWM